MMREEHGLNWLSPIESALCLRDLPVNLRARSLGCHQEILRILGGPSSRGLPDTTRTLDFILLTFTVPLTGYCSAALKSIFTVYKSNGYSIAVVLKHSPEYFDESAPGACVTQDTSESSTCPRLTSMDYCALQTSAPYTGELDTSTLANMDPYRSQALPNGQAIMPRQSPTVTSQGLVPPLRTPSDPRHYHGRQPGTHSPGFYMGYTGAQQATAPTASVSPPLPHSTLHYHAESPPVWSQAVTPSDSEANNNMRHYSGDYGAQGTVNNHWIPRSSGERFAMASTGSVERRSGSATARLPPAQIPSQTNNVRMPFYPSTQVISYE